MSRDRLPPPPPPPCLDRAAPSSQKGGTLIAEDVTDWEVHERLICAPDGYRPARCPACGATRLHVHDYRERELRGEKDRAAVRLVRHRCAECQATWRTVPLLLALRLQRSWPVIEAALGEPRPLPPARTTRRWASRLRATARRLVQVLATSGAAALVRIAQVVGLDARREELVVAHAGRFDVPVGRRLASVAALVHRLAPGARLM